MSNINKVNISRRLKLKLKQLYFEWATDQELIKVAKIPSIQLQDLLSNITFRKYTDENWVKWKRCLTCNVWKQLDKYTTKWVSRYWNKIIDQNCYECKKLLQKNYHVINKQKIKKDRSNYYKEVLKPKYNEDKDRVNKLRRDRFASLSEEDKEKQRYKWRLYQRKKKDFKT